MVKNRLTIGLVVPPSQDARKAGIDTPLANLARGLCERGHEVVLHTTANPNEDPWLHPSFQLSQSERLSLIADDLRVAMGRDDDLGGCDIIHDHTLASLFLRPRSHGVPIVVTNHGCFADDFADVNYHARTRVPIVAVSEDQALRAEAPLRVTDFIHHGVHLERYPFAETAGEYLVTFGRLRPESGIDTAVDIARRAGVPLHIASRPWSHTEANYFDEVIGPLLGDDVTYVGEPELNHRVELLAGALALLTPIRWPKPFGLTSIEAMAVGTPVITSSAGAGPELVNHGITGFVADDDEAMLAAIDLCMTIDRRDCRAHVSRSFSMAHMARNHERLYRKLIDRRIDRADFVDIFAKRGNAHTPHNLGVHPATMPAL